MNQRNRATSTRAGESACTMRWAPEPVPFDTKSWMRSPALPIGPDQVVSDPKGALGPDPDAVTGYG